jgi:hypothetical protein
MIVHGRHWSSERLRLTVVAASSGLSLPCIRLVSDPLRDPVSRSLYPSLPLF